MSDRQYKPTNRWGCMPTEDVCVQHDMPLECRHGCGLARSHNCLAKAARKQEAQEAKEKNSK